MPGFEKLFIKETQQIVNANSYIFLQIFLLLL